MRLEELGVLVGAEVTANGRARASLHVWRTGPDRAELLMDCANILSERERAGVVGKLPADVQEDARSVLDRLALDLYARLEEAGAGSDAADEDRSLFVDENEEPWPDHVDGAWLLGELFAVFRRFLVLPAGAAETMALWVLHAHAIDAAAISPLLAFFSPEKRCGKTNALRLVGAVTRRSLSGTNITPAAVFRTVEVYRPTLLIDEADTFLRENDELRGILNASHDRMSAQVVRLEKVGDGFEPRVFSTWCPKAVAMIGELPDTLADRSIQVRMRRRAPGETVERFRLDRLKDLGALRQQAARWALDALDLLRGADPSTPSVLNDRAADNWRPLLAIADVVGGSWPSRARAAALRLSGEAAEEAGNSPRTLLLGDLRALFTERGVDRLASSDIVAELAKREDRPWPEWSNGRPLSARGLARLLKPFGIGPRTVREGGTIFKGYLLADFADAWSRYLPSVSVTSVTPLALNDLHSQVSVTEGAGVTDKKSAKSLVGNDVTDVTDRKPGSGECERGDAWEGSADA